MRSPPLVGRARYRAAASLRSTESPVGATCALLWVNESAAPRFVRRFVQPTLDGLQLLTVESIRDQISCSETKHDRMD